MTVEPREPLLNPTFRGSVALYVPVMNPGGVESVMLRLVGAFARRGLKTWLVVHDRAGTLMAQVPAGVEVVDLGVSGGRAKVFASSGAIRPLGRFLRDNRPDALMTPFPHTNLIAVIARRLVDAPTRIVLSEHVPLDGALANHSPWRRKVKKTLIGWLYPRAAAVVSVSHGIKRTLVAVGVPEDRIHVLPNPVLEEDFQHRTQLPVDHPWFGDPSRPLVIGVGRLVPEKDFSTLVRAFARVRVATGARLVLVGEGAERAALERLIVELGLAEDVWLAGHQANPCAMIAKSRVLVSSSRFEGAPLVLVEALACGCPVVATSTVGGSETLENGRYGRIVPIGDPEAMAQAIVDTLREPLDPEPGRLSAAKFTVERSVASYLTLFGDVNRRKKDA
jgi:glycosyltransferase involved in cell wall biosynthesis